MTRYLLSFDCGKSSGVTLWSYSDEQPATRIGAWQFGGGAAGLRDWVETRLVTDPNGVWWWDFPGVDEVYRSKISYVVEKFTPLQGKGFSLTMDAVEPLVGEGVLIGLRIVPGYQQKVDQDCYQRPGEMYWCGGNTKAEKLKASRAWLKTKGLLLTGKDVGQKDADDAISSTLHALTWFRKRGHRSSLEHYWGEGE